MAEQQKPDKTFVAGPAGRKPTRAEAEAMAAALFEQIVAPRQAETGKADGPTKSDAPTPGR